jgi:hypothetical protein
MQVYTCASGNTNQMFSITADARIAWTNHGECLDLTDGSLVSGNPVGFFFFFFLLFGVWCLVFGGRVEFCGKELTMVFCLYRSRCGRVRMGIRTKFGISSKDVSFPFLSVPFLL